MAVSAQLGGDGKLFVGEDKFFELVVLDGAADTVGVKAVDMTGKRVILDIRSIDTSATVLFTQDAEIEGIFNQDPTVNTQLCVVFMTDDASNLFKGKTYRYTWKLMENDDETVLAWGDCVFQKATAP